MVPLMAGAGLLTGLAGTALSGFAADDKKDALKKVSETPGIDTGALTQQSLTDMLKYLGLGTQLQGKIGAANQATMNAQEELALPGISAARAKALGKVGSLFDEDSEWLKGVQRRGAALGLSSGLRSSSAGQRQTLKLSDTESMARTQLGTGLLGSLISSMRIANTPGVQSFLGPSPQELINLRSSERAQKMSLQAQQAVMPGMMDTWGSGLQQMGGAMTGAGMLGVFGGGGYGGTNGGFTM